jgi:GNAT superfamily N-acetyltransferase
VPGVAQVPDTPLRRARDDGYEVDTDPDRLDRRMIHRFLSTEAYWALGVPRNLVDRSIDHSLNFGVYRSDGSQVGFARVLTDTVVFAYLADVFVLPAERDRGLGSFLLETIVSHPDLRRLRRFSLATADAHGLYERFGWRPHPRPQDILEIRHSTEELYGA